MNTIVNVNNNPQMTFMAKLRNRKQLHEFIDKSNDFAMEILHKNRSLEEKGEVAKRKALFSFKCPYVGKIIEKGKATIEHITSTFKSGKPKDNDYEQFIKDAVKEGKIDSDHAGTLLINNALKKILK